MRHYVKFLSVGVTVLVVLVTLAGCPLLNPTKPGANDWYIELTIASPVTSQGIGLEEYEVTQVTVEVAGPGGPVGAPIVWYAGDGPQTYQLEVSQSGEYEIVVTHLGELDGEVVEAVESSTFMIEPMVITSITVVPGSVGTIDFDDGGYADAFELSGYWAALVGSEPGEIVPHLIYFEQTGDTSTGFDGYEMIFSATIDEPEVTLQATNPDGVMPLGTGMIQGDGTVLFDPPPEDFFHLGMAPLDPTFGDLELSGIVNLQRDKAMAGVSDPETWYELRVDILASPLNGSIMIYDDSEILPGTYSADTVEGMAFVDYLAGEDVYAELGSWVINPDGYSGSFDLLFENGGTLVGSYLLDPTDPMGATVTIDDGIWEGIPVTIGTFSEHGWQMETQVDPGYQEIRYLDLDYGVIVTLVPEGAAAPDLAIGTHQIPADVSLSLYESHSDWSYFEDEAVWGEITITKNQGDGMLSGYFEDVEFSTGYLSGSFTNVPYELNGFD